jgi:decaprenyl-phosphate phosphoribosyltransferase
MWHWPGRRGTFQAGTWIDEGRMSSVVQPSTPTSALPSSSTVQTRIADYISIARPDHWVKNVFALPGIAVALAFEPAPSAGVIVGRTILGLGSLCLIASSNYVINEILDAPTDRFHPTKSRRPIPSGRIRLPVAYAQWIALMLIGLALGAAVSTTFAATMLTLWIMGCVYNIRPLRSKDVPYVDVLSESVNNPLRMLAGWYIVSPAVFPPVSLLLSYWMAGAYFMAIKRFSEYRYIDDAGSASAYRKSFAYYTEPRLLVSIIFYASSAMLFFGAFLMRYRLELVLVFPLIAWVMAAYLSISFKEDSAAQAPERLYREPHLMMAVMVCALAMAMLLYVDVPALHEMFSPTVPVQAEQVLD